jgi:hypothetical protein
MAPFHANIVHSGLLLAIYIQVPPRGDTFDQRCKTKRLFVLFQEIVHLRKAHHIESRREESQSVGVYLPEFRYLDRQRSIFLFARNQHIPDRE